MKAKPTASLHLDLLERARTPSVPALNTWSISYLIQLHPNICWVALWIRRQPKEHGTFGRVNGNYHRAGCASRIISPRGIDPCCQTIGLGNQFIATPRPGEGEVSTAQAVVKFR